MPKVKALEDFPHLGKAAGDEFYLTVPETKRQLAAGTVERAGTKKKRTRKTDADADADA